MSDKEAARQIIDGLPDDATLEDILYALFVCTKFEKGLRLVREGKGIPQEEVRQRLDEMFPSVLRKSLLWPES